MFFQSFPRPLNHAGMLPSGLSVRSFTGMSIYFLERFQQVDQNGRIFPSILPYLVEGSISISFEIGSIKDDHCARKGNAQSRHKSTDENSQRRSHCVEDSGSVGSKKPVFAST